MRALLNHLRNNCFMNYEMELKNIENHVIRELTEHDTPGLYYHNLTHTTEVVEASKEIAAHYDLNEHDRFLLIAAAWFHDIAYPFDRMNHEQKSAETAEQYLKNTTLASEEIEIIKKCILATTVPQEPHSLLEEIICDADLFYLGTDRYKVISKLLKNEIQAFNNNIPVDEFEWRKEKIRFFEAHHYHTEYCQAKLNGKKEENLTNLKNKQMNAIVEQSNGNELVSGDADKKKKKGAVKKDKKPSRGIETMFRISSANSVRISEMADNKAHIMISVNSIIISVVLAFLLKNIDEYMHLLIPTIILVAVNILTITFAVLATRPRISKGTFTQKQVEEKSVNLLFFGSFYKMNYPEYKDAVNKMMSDSEFLYGSLTKDIYWQGKVLGRKYRLLRISYNIFMYGMIASVLAFSIASILY
jgi:predicted metal-dependent HD superfamily phosphohydrolase